MVGALLGAVYAAQARASERVPSLHVACSPEGGQLKQGDTLTIRWESGYAPAGASVSLTAEKVATGHRLRPFATGLNTTGELAWRIPAFVPSARPCAPDPTGGCIGDMNPGTAYAVVALLVAPAGPRDWPRASAQASCRPFTLVE